MIIYGVAVLAACLLVGKIIGGLLGSLLGVSANVGGVGFAMILLIFITDKMKNKGFFPTHSADGVLFWSAMYIPIVVAMAVRQNVVAAMDAGSVALLVGVITTIICLAMVPIISRIGGIEKPLPPIHLSKED